MPSVPPIQQQLTSNPWVTLEQEGITPATATIGEMTLPYEDKLSSFATIDSVAFNEWFDIVKSTIEKINTLEVSRLALSINPDDFDDAYFSALLTKTADTILNSINVGGTGLPPEIEESIFNRARQRALTAATREVRRIATDISKRLPYAGQIADLIIEADRSAMLLINDTNLAIMVKQAELAYQNQRDIIKEAIEFEKLRIAEFDQRMERSLRAFVEHDKLMIEEYWKFYQFTLEKIMSILKALSGDLLKLLASGAQQLSFENWMQMSKAMAEGQLRIAGLIAQLGG